MRMSGSGETEGLAAEPWALRWGSWIVAIGGALTVGIGLASVFWLPTVDALVGEFSDGDLQRARADIRSSGLKLATGVGAATAGLLAWGRLDLSRQQHRLDEQSKQDERFARSVELLGSENRSVRLGALYALEALAKDGYANQTIYDVITAFARSAAVDTFETTVGDSTLELHDGGDGNVLPELTNYLPTAEDLEAAITVCLRSPQRTRLDLRGVMISNRTFGDLSSTNLAASQLVDCRFEGSISDVSFVGATILRSRFKSMSMEDCKFEGAVLTECHVESVEISGTLLGSAEFEGCDVRSIEVDRTSTAPSGWGSQRSEGQESEEAKR